MKTHEVLNAIRTVLGMDVKLAQMTLVDGTTILEAESFEAGMEVFIVTQDGNVPLPVGEYELENGQMLVVAQEGIIAEIKEVGTEEEAPSAEEAPEMEPAEATMSDEAKPKKTIESIIKETLFSEVEKLKAENEELKSKLAGLELSNHEPVKPIVFNPENEQKQEMFKYATKRQGNATDRVMSKLFN